MEASSVVFWSICLIILLVLLFGVTAFMRKRLSPNEDFHGDGFTLGDLRRMHKAGKMTDEEFEQTKAVLLASLGAKAAKPADPLSDTAGLKSTDKPL